MKILDLKFPASAKEEWVQYLGTLNENPYTEYKTLGPKLAEKLISILQETVDHSAREDERFYAHALLHEINAQKEGKGSKALVVRDFPIDDVTGIATPTTFNDFNTNNKGYISEYSQLALMSAIGFDLISDPSISGGAPFQHITPRKGREKDKGNAGSKEDFSLHTERSFDAKPPDALSLLGIRNWTQTPTNLFCLDNVLKYLTKKEIKTLHEDQFEFPSGDALNSGARAHQGPVITQVNGTNEYRLKLDTMLGKSNDAKAIIEKLTKIFSNPDKYLGVQGSVVITPGTMLTFDNRTLGHGRPAFVGEKAHPSPMKQSEGQERWLQRITAHESSSLSH